MLLAIPAKNFAENQLVPFPGVLSNQLESLHSPDSGFQGLKTTV
jgi:hypothetical protein